MQIPDPPPEAGQVACFVSVTMTDRGVVVYNMGGEMNLPTLLGLLEMAKLEISRNHQKRQEGPQIVPFGGPIPNLRG